MPYTPPLTTCATCEGDGKSNGDLCPDCFGSGTTPLIDKGSLLAKAIVSRLEVLLLSRLPNAKILPLHLPKSGIR